MWVLLDFHLSNTKPTHPLSFSHSFPLFLALSVSFSSQPLSRTTDACKLSDWPLHWQYLQLNHILCSSLSSSMAHAVFAASLCYHFTHLLIFQHFQLTSVALPFGLNQRGVVLARKCLIYLGSSRFWADLWGRHVFNHTESICVCVCVFFLDYAFCHFAPL